MQLNITVLMLENLKTMQAFDENGNPLPQYQVESKRVIAGILGILLGSLGIHKFVLGYTNQGLILLAITILGPCLEQRRCCVL